MILNWRILYPFRTTFISITQIVQIQFSINQLSALIKIPYETQLYH